VHKALVEGHVQPILNSDTLPEALGEYRALILADQRILSPREVEAIRAFVAAGGGLVVLAGSGVRDGENQPLADFALGEVLGLRFKGMNPYATAYLRVPAGADIPGVPAMDVQVVGPSVRVELAGARPAWAPCIPLAAGRWPIAPWTWAPPSSPRARRCCAS
jgi:hypothetical protein